MILSVNYTHSSSLVHYILLGLDGSVVYDGILSSGSQSITLSNSLPGGNYTLYSMDPYDMNKVIQETVSIPNCIPVSPSATPSVTPSKSPNPPGSVSVTPTPSPSKSISVTPSTTPGITPSPSSVWTTYIQMTKYPEVQGGGTIEVWNTNNIRILLKNTSDLSSGANSFPINPYSGPYRIYLSNIYTIDGPPAYTSVSSNTGEYQTSVYGFMSVSDYGRLSGGTSAIDITLGQASNTGGGCGSNTSQVQGSQIGIYYTCSGGNVVGIPVYQNSNSCYTGTSIYLVNGVWLSVNPSNSSPNTTAVWVNSGSPYCIPSSCTLRQDQVQTNPCASGTTRTINTGIVNESCGTWDLQYYCTSYSAPYEYRSREVNYCSGATRNDTFIEFNSVSCGYVAPTYSAFNISTAGTPINVCTRIVDQTAYCIGGSPDNGKTVYTDSIGSSTLAAGYYATDNGFIHVNSSGVIDNTGIC